MCYKATKATYRTNGTTSCAFVSHRSMVKYFGWDEEPMVTRGALANLILVQ